MDKYDILLGVAIGIVLGVPIVLYLLSRGSSSASYSPVRTYTNEEVWEIVRDEDGITKEIRVKRTAKET